MPSPVRNPLSARSCAVEWHPTLNGDLTPDQVPSGTSRKAWWTCGDCGHVWQASISNRAYNGVGCPLCGRLRAASAQRNSAGPRTGPTAAERNPLSAHPAADQFHPTLNGDLTPDDVSAGSKRSVWWLCPDCGHAWRARVQKRTSASPSTCPACSHSAATARAVAANPLSARPVSLFFHPTRNGDLTVGELSAGSARKVWWECPDCGHAWRAAVNRCTRAFRCPRCRPRATSASDPARQLPLSTHPLAVEWHPTRNGDLAVERVTVGSSERVWWLCPECGHEWQAQIGKRTLNGTGCPRCSRRKVSERAAESNPLSVHPVARLFHPTRNGDLTVHDLSAGSTERVWWKCADCGHEWQRPVYQSVPNRGCPACSPFSPRSAVRRNPLSARPIAAQFHPTLNGDLTPDDLSAGSKRKVWWLCPECGHEWEQSPNARTTPSKRSGCPACTTRAAVGPRPPRPPKTVLADHPVFAEFHPTLNGDLFDPTKRSATSTIKVWWLCPKCDQPYMATPHKRVKLGRGCPNCDDGRRHRWAKARAAEAAKTQAPQRP